MTMTTSTILELFQIAIYSNLVYLMNKSQKVKVKKKRLLKNLVTSKLQSRLEVSENKDTFKEHTGLKLISRKICLNLLHLFLYMEKVILHYLLTPKDELYLI